MSTTAYTSEFYGTIRGGSRRSALEVIPILLELIQPKSVIDVGCGDGSWLAMFREHGITETIGLDGEYVDRRMLQIPQDQFKATDLASSFELARTFDLAVSLEVAEHLPQESAAGFVDSLVKLAPVVLFSAAIPFQGGTQHLNEQWPDYWADLFRRHGYLSIDCIRGKIWDNCEVEWWYAQNCLVFAKASVVEHNQALRAAYNATIPRQLNLVCPRLYLPKAEFLSRPEYNVRTSLRLLGRSLNSAVRRRMQHGLRRFFRS